MSNANRIAAALLIALTFVSFTSETVEPVRPTEIKNEA